MNFIGKMLAVVQSNIGLLGRKIIGVRLNFRPITLVSWGADLRTDGRDARIQIGSKSVIRKCSELHAAGGHILIGDNCFLNRNCLICAHEHITIKDGVTIGPGSYIYDHDHDGNGGYVTSPVTIGRNVWIGAGCIILKGLSIGENSVIAAGAVVTKDVAPGTMVAGIPARQIAVVK